MVARQAPFFPKYRSPAKGMTVKKMMVLALTDSVDVDHKARGERPNGLRYNSKGNSIILLLESRQAAICGQSLY